jgi:hypothetical protein
VVIFCPAAMGTDASASPIRAKALMVFSLMAFSYQ